MGENPRASSRILPIPTFCRSRGVSLLHLLHDRSLRAACLRDVLFKCQDTFDWVLNRDSMLYKLTPPLLFLPHLRCRDYQHPLSFPRPVSCGVRCSRRPSLCSIVAATRRRVFLVDPYFFFLFGTRVSLNSQHLEGAQSRHFHR